MHVSGTGSHHLQFVFWATLPYLNPSCVFQTVGKRRQEEGNEQFLKWKKQELQSARKHNKCARYGSVPAKILGLLENACLSESIVCTDDNLSSSFAMWIFKHCMSCSACLQESVCLKRQRASEWIGAGDSCRHCLLWAEHINHQPVNASCSTRPFLHVPFFLKIKFLLHRNLQVVNTKRDKVHLSAKLSQSPLFVPFLFLSLFSPHSSSSYFLISLLFLFDSAHLLGLYLSCLAQLPCFVFLSYQFFLVVTCPTRVCTFLPFRMLTAVAAVCSTRRCTFIASWILIVLRVHLSSFAYTHHCLLPQTTQTPII